MEESRMGSTNTEPIAEEEEFLDIQTGAVMSREEFIAQINSGKYPGYYVSKGVKSTNDQHGLK